jgi:hypothetical protein
MRWRVRLSDHSDEAFGSHAEAAGFEVRVVERGVSGRKKRVDTGVVTRICRDTYVLGRRGGTASP